jgi:hypothetical protein
MDGAWSNDGMVLTGETEVLGEKHYIVWVVDGWMGMGQWLEAHNKPPEPSHCPQDTLMWLAVWLHHCPSANITGNCQPTDMTSSNKIFVVYHQNSGRLSLSNKPRGDELGSVSDATWRVSHLHKVNELLAGT